MQVGHNFPTAYTLQDNIQIWKLVEVDAEKDFEIFIAKDLKVANQWREAARKAMNVLRVIKRHFKLDKPTFLILYKSYIRPILNMASKNGHHISRLKVWRKYNDGSQN